MGYLGAGGGLVQGVGAVGKAVRPSTVGWLEAGVGR